ncbi:MAG: hypothetical protein OEV74_08385 [Cyclobacteriaceae bacterium]|nr:hypothetical protein [Cyclobacteriaceae bacterium]
MTIRPGVRFVEMLVVTLSLLLVNCTRKQDSQHQDISKVEIRDDAGRYELLVNGKAFYIKGAGLEFGSVEKLAEHGGNSFRTWRTDNGRQTGKQVLDLAYENGLRVAMGIEVARERHGFDYNDNVAVKKQFDEIKAQVMELKDHPALIIWDIGNELNLNATNPKVWDAVNDISKMIHEVDTNHLTTTSLAGISKALAADIALRAPDLDFLSIQMYADIVNLPKYIREIGWEGPYLVTEWGATGHWEIQKTDWGAPIENNSTVKAKYYLERYQNAIQSQQGQCLGSFVFLWGQKQERTPTWYGIFLEDGTETESVDVMHFLWNNAWPQNRSPAVESVTLDNKGAADNIYLSAGKTYRADAVIQDPDHDSLTYHWEIMPESKDLGEGGDLESKPEVVPDLIKNPTAAQIELKAPTVAGAYRLFMYAYDDHGHAAHANIPFYVNAELK